MRAGFAPRRRHAAAHRRCGRDSREIHARFTRDSNQNIQPPIGGARAAAAWLEDAVGGDASEDGGEGEEHVEHHPRRDDNGPLPNPPAVSPRLARVGYPSRASAARPIGCLRICPQLAQRGQEREGGKEGGRERASERASEEASKRGKERGKERTSERASRASERWREGRSEEASEQGRERASERARDGRSERGSERGRGRQRILTRSPANSLAG